MPRQSSHLGQLFEHARKAKGTRKTELVSLLGYRNLAKGHRRLDRLESQGKTTPGFLRQVAAILNVDESDIRRTSELDRAAERAAWQAWADKPVPLEMKVKWFSGFYAAEPLPAHVAEDPAAAESYARRFAREHGVAVCLALNRRESIWIGADGKVFSRHRAQPGDSALPRMTMKGRLIPDGTFGTQNSGQRFEGSLRGNYNQET
jgi:hypothetical protein